MLTPARRPKLLPLPPAFVGRAAELALVQAVLEAPMDGVQALHFHGGAGSGKSRLLEAIAGLARAHGLTPLACTCGLGEERPFGPFIRLFQQHLPEVEAAAATAAPEQRAALAALLPELGLMAAPAPLEPREAQLITQSAVCHVLGALAGSGAVLTLDDWDQADAASVAAVAYLRRNGRRTPLLLVATARNAGYLDPDAHGLPGLSRDEAAAFGTSMLDGELPSDFTAALHRWTGGNPGQMQGLIAHLLRTQALERRGKRWRAPLSLAARDLAPELLAAATEPLAALTAPAQAVAELVAVLGAEASREALAMLSGLDAPQLKRALVELHARQILVDRDGRPGFASGGLQQAAFARANEGRQLWLHALAALYLEGERAGRDDADLHIALARHYLGSRQVPKARPAVLKAAEMAMARAEVEVARGLLVDALALDGRPDDAWRGDALVQLAAVERWRGDFEAMGAALDAAEPLVEARGDAGVLLRELVLRAAYCNQRMTPAALERAIALLTRALALPLDAPLWQARGRYFLAQAHFYLGRREAASRAFEAAAVAAERDHLPFWQAKSLAFGGYLQTAGGEAEEGFRRLAEAASIQGELGDRYGRCFTLALQSEALLDAMRLAEAEAVLEDQLAVAWELGVGEDHVTCLANLGVVRALQGRFRAALEACEEAVPLAHAQGQTVGLLARAVGGYALVSLGELARGSAWLEEAGAEGRRGATYMLVHALPFLLEGWRCLGRPDEMARLVDDTHENRAGAEPGPQAQVAALAGEARLLLAGPEAVQAMPESASPLARLLGARLQARVERTRGGDAAAAVRAALDLAEASGAAALGAEVMGLGGTYPAMRRYAEREGVPALRARALLGEAAADPALEAEARRVLAALADPLEPLARRAFLAAHFPEEASPEPQGLHDRLALLERLARELRDAPDVPEGYRRRLARALEGRSL